MSTRNSLDKMKFSSTSINLVALTSVLQRTNFSEALDLLIKKGFRELHPQQKSKDRHSQKLDKIIELLEQMNSTSIAIEDIYREFRHED